jgi:hypothetical protein
VDHKLKKLFQQLGEAINQSLAESDEIAETIGKIKTSGYDVFLVLEATIGFSKQDDSGDEPDAGDGSGPEFKVSSQDMKFLRSLRIKLDDSA